MDTTQDITLAPEAAELRAASDLLNQYALDVFERAAAKE